MFTNGFHLVLKLKQGTNHESDCNINVTNHISFTNHLTHIYITWQ